MDRRLRRDLHDEAVEVAWMLVVVVAAVGIWALCMALG